MQIKSTAALLIKPGNLLQTHIETTKGSYQRNRITSAKYLLHTPLFGLRAIPVRGSF